MNQISKEDEKFLRSWRPAKRDPEELEYWQKQIQKEVNPNGLQEKGQGKGKEGLTFR